MTIRKIKSPAHAKNDEISNWVEPEKSNWRDDSESDVVSDNDEENEESNANYDNSKFVMTPSRL